MVDCEECINLAEALEEERRASHLLRKAILSLVNKSMDSTLFEDGEEIISIDDVM